jgi:DNA topoisomerase-3
MVDKLLRDGRIRLKDCKSAKTGKTYNATALLTTAADGKAVFELQFEKGGERK